jgi:hypothetical protein
MTEPESVNRATAILTAPKTPPDVAITLAAIPISRPPYPAAAVTLTSARLRKIAKKDLALLLRQENTWKANFVLSLPTARLSILAAARLAGTTAKCIWVKDRAPSTSIVRPAINVASKRVSRAGRNIQNTPAFSITNATRICDAIAVA